MRFSRYDKCVTRIIQTHALGTYVRPSCNRSASDKIWSVRLLHISLGVERRRTGLRFRDWSSAVIGLERFLINRHSFCALAVTVCWFRDQLHVQCEHKYNCSFNPIIII